MNRFKGSDNIKSKIEFDIENVIDKYNSYVFKIVNNIARDTLSYQDKEEIVSDTFFLLWKYRDNIESDIKSYLGKIAKNVTYKKIKGNKKYNEYDDKINGDIQTFDSIEIESLLSYLNEGEKEIFTLYYINGYKIKEIAKMKKKSISAVKMNLLRLRKKLRRILINEKY